MQTGTSKKRFLLDVIYKTSDNNWRAFCYPFDISCEAKSKEEAYKRLKKLVNLYVEGLKEYGYPEHLAKKELSNKEDKVILTEVKKYIILKQQKRLEEDLFGSEASTKIEITEKGLFGFYQQELAYC
ncbi:MAG: hypothetical protein WA091_01795 [Minisyncoccales bacterium]